MGLRMRIPLLLRLSSLLLRPRHRYLNDGFSRSPGRAYRTPMPNTIESLTAEIRAFRDARDWLPFHNPKELAVAITAEAGELLQHFVWQDPAQSEQRVRDRRDELASEMADIAILLLELADNCQIPLADAIRSKLAVNNERYPVAKAKGSNKKYNEL